MAKKSSPRAVYLGLLLLVAVVLGYNFITVVHRADSRSLTQEVAVNKLTLPPSLTGHSEATTPAPTAPTPVNNFGFSADELVWKNADDQAAELDGIKATGAGWVRIDMEWYVVQPTAGTFDWSVYDRIIDAINQRGLKTLAILDYAPSWDSIGGCRSSEYHKCAPADPAPFAAFAAVAAARYAQKGVTAWEIWNEPNAPSFWYPRVSAAGYTALLKAAYPAIKQANPNATVITGGLTSSATYGTVSPPDFVTALYNDGAEPYFDAIGAHPYSYPTLPSVTADWSGWTQMLRVEDIAAANGDSSKKIWMTEVGAATGGLHYVSENFQAKIVEQTIQLHNSYTWAGPLFWYNYQDLGTNPYVSRDFFGLVRFDGTRKTAYDAFLQAVKE
ncbi:MAG TPA: cellulase family glycosylhydrolase [Candidatus Acidoferrum sp.]|nr:cellulase family glycosylhydrolase [Candidatus Acidoferrum sp.]